jgi:hypothetical protein
LVNRAFALLDYWVEKASVIASIRSGTVTISTLAIK